MKAIEGNLRIDQTYTLVGQDYHGKFSETLSCEQCENCGNAILNIAIVEGSDDKNQYRIGLDCAATLTGILPNAIAEAKKKLRNRAKFLKFVKQECKVVIHSPKHNTIWLYKSDVKEWRPSWVYRVSDKNIDVLPKGVKIIEKNLS